MGSIFGIVDYGKGDFEHIWTQMFEALVTRGGVHRNIHQEEQFLIGTRGDEQTVKQTLVNNPPKTVIAVIEGEIYNFKALQRLLGNGPGHLSPETAIQAIIPLYEKFGTNFPQYLNGIFTIALWDKQKRTLLLVRDHLGAHSVFYTQQGQSFLFASTICALLRTGLVSRDVSLPAVQAYFSSTAIHAPDTMFTQIAAVRPGAMVMINNGTLKEYTYWNSRAICEDFQRSESAWLESVRELILDAINIRAEVGGRYGTLLSGGVDTSIIAATLATTHPEKALPGFSIAFAETFYSDADLQQIMYNRYNIQPHVATIGPQEFAEILQKGVSHLDKPVNDNAFVGMYKAFELAKQVGYQFVFDGEAADELFFTGHARGELDFQRYLAIPFDFRRRLLGALFPSIPLGESYLQKACRLLYKLGLSNEERILTRLPCFYKHATSILTHPERVAQNDPLRIGKQYLAESELQDPLNYYHYGLLKTFLPDDLLFKNERMAAAHGITIRTPFIDYRLVELAFRIPARFKITQATPESDGTKLIYKKAIQGLIPDEILQRKKKRGFSQPSSGWYRRELKDFVYDTLLNPQALCLEYVNKSYMTELVRRHVSGQANFDYLLSSLLIFELWLQAFH